MPCSMSLFEMRNFVLNGILKCFWGHSWSASVSPGRYILGIPFFAQPGFLASLPKDFRLPPQATAVANYQATQSAWNQPLEDRLPYNEARCYVDNEADHSTYNMSESE